MYKKLLFLLYLFLFSCFGVYSFSGGTGTALDPYEVSNCDELQNISQVANLDDYYVLTQNIDCSEISNFQPIGSCSGSSCSTSSDDGFAGSFNGSGNIISNVIIENLSSTYAGWGLFGFVESGGIYDLGVENIVVNVPLSSRVGGLVGDFRSGPISRVYVVGDITGRELVGGVFGLFYATTTDVFFIGNVTSLGGVGDTGGIAGNAGYSSITNSYAIANIVGTVDVGGLVGNNYNNNLINSYFIGNVSGSSNVGGLVGLQDDGFDFTNSYWNNESTNVNFTVGSGLSTGITTIENNYSYFLDPTQEPMASWDPTIWTLTLGQLPYITTIGNPYGSSPGSSIVSNATSSIFPIHSYLSISILALLLGYFFM
ncbi:MAG: hypothetical protein VXZ40_02990 [Nanoarchaeota archaeon]|nr:hypothetical protein [Nanoarchaeota archaeon]